MADAEFVHRFVRGESPSTLLLLHGTGGDEDDLLPLGRHLLPHANLLSPRGKVLEAGMPRFFRRLAMGVFDVEDLKMRTEELAKFIGASCERYDLDSGSVIAVGYSNGANIAASLLLARPGLLRGAALLHAMVPYEPDPLPDLSSTPVILTGGRRDPMIPEPQIQQLARLLRAAGADLELHLEPGGHELTPPEVEQVRRWLGRLAPVTPG